MKDLAKQNVIKLIQEKSIEIVNLCHIPDDSHLKTLSFAVKNKDRLKDILEFGERVDGSSLFSYIDPSRSDVYIVPKIESGFINPFSSVPTLNILSEYLDEYGKPLETAPQSILQKAEEKLYSSTGIALNAFAELEFYVIDKQQSPISNVSGGNYHESAPFAKFEDLRNEILVTLENLGIATKYGHAEAGRFHTRNGDLMEQHEIEFLPQALGRMAETITIARWIIRNICQKHGVSASFSPKPAWKHTGNGMHIHICALKNNRNVIADHHGNLTTEAIQIIGGILRFAPSLTAFGNTIPVSYLRFISQIESPKHICWGARNRLSLIRLPLWWDFKRKTEESENCRRTFEYRSPDSSANIYLLLAGIALAAEYGLKNPKEVTRIAEELNIDENVDLNKEYVSLPLSCVEAAHNLKRDRKHYEADRVFPRKVIDQTIGRLESFKDRKFRENLINNQKKIDSLTAKYLDYG